MLYLPSNYNETDNLVDLAHETMLFERQWPPVLDEFPLHEFGEYHLATVEVMHEADCAYRCYNVDDCRGFVLRCRASRKCDSFSCCLLSEMKRDEL